MSAGHSAPQDPPSAPAAEVYLDHASATPMHPAAREVLTRALEQGYADPRRLHRPARSARMLLDNARAVVAECLGVRPEEVTFTPSGTHACHLGVLGLLAGRARHTNDVLLAGAVEHSAVLHAGAWHRARGGTFDTVGVDRHGRVRSAALDEALTEHGEPAVLAVQSANPEVGVCQPVAELATATGAPLFVDACASAAYLPLPPGWAAAAVSAHKWGGPAGVGVLLVRKGARWRNPLPGDERVDERSVGFENVPAALAAAAALQARVADREADTRRLGALTEELAAVCRTVPDTEVFLAPGERLPHLVAFSCLYLDGEALVTALDRRGFAVASGSACTSSTLQPSHVLEAMGALTHGNVRVSLGPDTAAEEVRRLGAELPGIVDRLRTEAGVPR